MNNDGYSLLGEVEEVSVDEVRALFDTNRFGAVRVIQATLAILREQGSRHIVGVSSFIGLLSLPVFGLYSASKWTLEATHESVAHEFNSLGIKVTMLKLRA